MTKLVDQQFKLLPENAVPLPHLHASPSLVARSWPADVPVIALIAGGTNASWSRWSIIAPATGKRLTLDGPTTMSELRKKLEVQGSDALLPNWIGYLGYELGHVIEPTTAELPKSDWPLVDLFWCDRALVHDGKSDSWWSVGNLEPPDLCIEFPSQFSMGALHDDAGDDHSSRRFTKQLGTSTKVTYSKQISLADSVVMLKEIFETLHCQCSVTPAGTLVRGLNFQMRRDTSCR